MEVLSNPKSCEETSGMYLLQLHKVPTDIDLRLAGETLGISWSPHYPLTCFIFFLKNIQKLIFWAASFPVLAASFPVLAAEIPVPANLMLKRICVPPNLSVALLGLMDGESVLGVWILIIKVELDWTDSNKLEPSKLWQLWRWPD